MSINDKNDTQEDSDMRQQQDNSISSDKDHHRNDPGFTEQSMPREPQNSTQIPKDCFQDNGAPVPPPGWQQNHQSANQPQPNGEVANPEPNRRYGTHEQQYNQAFHQQPQQQTSNSNEPKYDEDGFAQAYVNGQNIKVTSDELSLLASGKKLSTFAFISAPVSLLFGGSLLSAISLITAIIGYRKFAEVANRHSGNEQVSRALKKTGMMPIAASCIALIINIIAAVIMFPILLQQIESSPDGIMSLFGGAGSTAATGSGTGTQTWG